jgi:hypothetical protein
MTEKTNDKAPQDEKGAEQVQKADAATAKLDLPEPVHSEARVIAFADFTDPKGQTWSITAREGFTGAMVVDMANKCASVTTYLLAHGWAIAPKGGGKHSAAPARVAASHPMNVEQSPTPTTPPPPPSASAPAPVQGQVQGGDGYTKRGTKRLLQITVDGEGKVEFKVQGLKGPLPCWGAEKAASLFDSDLGGWTPQHFAGPVLYTEQDFGRLFVDYGKSIETGYWDPLRVHK